MRGPGSAGVGGGGFPAYRGVRTGRAVFVPKVGSEVTAGWVGSHVKARLADYKVPKRVDFVAELPRNPTGKLLKRELRAERTNPV